MIKGTFDGDKEEIGFVKKFNNSKDFFADYISTFSNNYENIYMVRVTSKQVSKLNNKKVFTRSDCYLAYFKEDINDILVYNDYLLDENILKKNNVKFDIIKYSGISIKMKTSNSYQILKTGPNSFYEFFGSYELGAGASLFCKKEEELIKNQNLVLGWKSDIDKMNVYFSKFINGTNNFLLNKEICFKIKSFSLKKIKELILDDVNLQKKIFNGINLYDEPYTAFYFYHGNTIQKLTYIDFNVTTGSGRSKGDYTIVLKPK